MNVTATEIERVVEEVLRALHACRGLDSGVVAAKEASAAISSIGSAGGQVESAVSAAPSVSIAGTRLDEARLTVCDRVVTLSRLDGKLAGVREIVVLPNAIVTPAVRDELHRRGVAITVSPAGSAQVATVRVVLAATGTKFDPAPLTDALSGEGVFVVPHVLDCLIASCDLLAQQVKQEKTLGVLLTRYVGPALCLANRLAGVRAVSATSVPGVRAAAGMSGANVLVLDPAASGFFMLKRMVAEYLRGGIRPCPEVFRARLG